ncbi:Hypothetical predicted protein [Cloeon dipterum]|uniref:Uncharacterized protein n=1 Tax=Cloeon dipterum TaxID=197152 RepID=A0A8S1DEZ2_9INSE|nr:Hypothetical predicted protein [Cloeon dipterum]
MKRMGKARFYDRFLFVLLTATALLVSGIESTKKNEKIKEQLENSIHKTNKYYSMKIHYFNYPEDGTIFLWKNLEGVENVKNLSADQFVLGKTLINLPFGLQLFDLNVTRVAVTKEGTIQSADPSVNWTIAPLNADIGMARCNISYLIQDKIIYVQWNNFRFNHKKFEKHELSFQVRLGERGEIDFVYKEVPFNLTDLRGECLKDKFGITYDHEELFKVPPYNETYELGFLMDLKAYEVKNGTVVRFLPSDWCMGQKNCHDCTETGFYLTSNQIARCSWCPAIEKCSSTRDSLLHVWKEYNCEIHHVNSPIFCHLETPEAQLFLTVLLVILIIMILALLVCICIMLNDGIVEIVCCIKPSKRHRELIQPTNQPNQSVDNNQAEDQNNDQEDQEDQESQEEQEIEPGRNCIYEDIPMTSGCAFVSRPDIHWIPGNLSEIQFLAGEQGSDDDDNINTIPKLSTYV